MGDKATPATLGVDIAASAATGATEEISAAVGGL